MDTFHHRSRMPASGSELFRWHARPGAFERLTPPWEPVEIVERPESLEDGTRAVIAIRMGPFRKRWVAEHRDYTPETGFDDVQIAGPFAHWHHRHRMHPAGPDASELEDRIEYRLPLGFLGRLVGGGSVRRKLTRMFRYRHAVTAEDLRAHGSASDSRPLKVVITGASGFLGRTLVPFLTTGGHEVVTLARGDREGPSWDPAAGRLDPALLEGADAVIHLAGENVAGGRWSAARKERILRSRTDGTGLVARTIAGLERPPAVFVCASAIGVYGDRGDEALDEDSEGGTGFLADVVRAWEAVCTPAADAGVRVVNLRFGIILGAAGGALARMLPPFRLGLGGRLGSGRQVMSWVGVDDAAAAVLHALRSEELSGPVNVTAPEPLSNRAFTKTLGRVLRRWTFLPAPAFALRLLFGEMGDAVLLRGARVLPKRLLATGFRFRHPDLESCLRHGLGRTESGTESE
ncbi:MAG: TIGR01777 family oxidoreductase [Planctomycetota bacterium]|nr:TIGR01777 family oxidoreductase [Planctomycetota bacterium]